MWWNINHIYVTIKTIRRSCLNSWIVCNKKDIKMLELSSIYVWKRANERDSISIETLAFSISHRKWSLKQTKKKKKVNWKLLPVEVFRIVDARLHFVILMWFAQLLKKTSWRSFCIRHHRRRSCCCCSTIFRNVFKWTWIQFTIKCDFVSMWIDFYFAKCENKKAKKKRGHN